MQQSAKTFNHCTQFVPDVAAVVEFTLPRGRSRAQVPCPAIFTLESQNPVFNSCLQDSLFQTSFRYISGTPHEQQTAKKNAQNAQSLPATLR